MYSKLERDWKEDPRLSEADYETVEELAEFLRKSHAFLMSESAGPLGYLYAQQVLRVRELKEKLNEH